MAVRCRRQVGEIDLLGRCGGDEFISMLVETDALEGRNIAERIRQQIAETPIETERGPLNIIICLGVRRMETSAGLIPMKNCTNTSTIGSL